MFSNRTAKDKSLNCSLMYALSSLLVVMLLLASTVKAVKRDVSSNSNLTDRSVDLDALNELLDSLATHIDRLKKRSCQIGLQSHNCVLSDLSKLMQHKAFLASGASPGKRSGGNTEGQGWQVVPQDILQEARTLQDGLAEQRQIIRRLQQLMRSLRERTDDQQAQPLKKSCRFRLGGHCLTEELDRAATQYYYLKSPDSPGRRRRSTKSNAEGSQLPVRKNIKLVRREARQSEALPEGRTRR